MPNSPTAAAIAAALALSALAGPAAAQTTEALQIAVMSDDPAAIAAAIRAGSDPRAATRDGSLLAHAALMGKARAVAALLAAGADPAARAAAVEVVRLLAARKAGLDTPIRVGPTSMTPLMLAAQAGAADVVQILLEAGANPNAMNGGRYTALDYAVDRPPVWAALPQDGRAAIVRALVAKGARRDRAGADGITPPARARALGDAEIVAALDGR